ncbi:MAG: acetate--CoA ligase family protein [Woeseia sp.]
MSAKAALERLLKPKTVAVFGGDDAARVIEQCRAAGFDGEVWAVNPKRRELNGVPCFDTVADLPAAPDASFLGTPPAASVEIIRDLAAIGAGGAVCYAAGFAEAGAEGARLQDRLRDAAGVMAIIGPNCHGFLNYFDGVALWPDNHGGRRVDRGVALVLQSGNFGINMSMQLRSLDLGYVITIGNKSSLDIHDFIEMLLDDPRVTAIGLHIEGIGSVHAFSAAAIKALAQGVPIVAIKTGSSKRGAELTMSHTASLAGSARLYSALFDRVGIAQCETIPQFLETLKFLSTVGALPGKRLGSMSCSGGEASLIADCAESLGLDMPELSDASAARLRDILGPIVHISNPLDYHTYAWSNYEQLKSCFTAMLESCFDCAMLVLDYPLTETADTANWETTERALIDAAAATGQRAVIVATLPETLPADVRTRLLEAGIAPMQGIHECLFAIKAAASVGKAQACVGNIHPVAEPEPVRGPVTVLNEYDSKAELADFGLVIPEGRICSASGIVGTAEGLGFPVVLKAVSEGLAHKSDVGAIALNLRDAPAVQSAIEGMAGQFDRFLVEKMAGPVVAEMIVGISRDATFGLTLLIGAGGTLVELLEDTVSLLLPVERDGIRAAIGTLKVSKLVDSYRGGIAGNMEAVVDAVMAVADYALANNASLQELDVNPLIVTPDKVIAADAFIRKAGK